VAARPQRLVKVGHDPEDAFALHLPDD
jgi:hypothetical protein